MRWVELPALSTLLNLFPLGQEVAQGVVEHSPAYLKREHRIPSAASRAELQDSAACEATLGKRLIGADQCRVLLKSNSMWVQVDPGVCECSHVVLPSLRRLASRWRYQTSSSSAELPMVKPREDAKASQLNVSVMILPPLRTSHGSFVVLPNYRDQPSPLACNKKSPRGLSARSVPGPRQMRHGSLANRTSL